MSKVTADIKAKVLEVKKNEEEKQATARAERLNTSVKRFGDRLMTRMPKWLAKEEQEVRKDLHSFIEEANLGDYFMAQQVALYQGIVSTEGAHKDCGAYIFGFEKSREGSHYPYVLKFGIRSTNLLAKMLAAKERLNVKPLKWELSEELLSFEKGFSLPVQFVSQEDWEEIKKFDLDPIEVGETSVKYGDETYRVKAHVAVADGKVVCTREDWYKGNPSKPDDFTFDLRQVPARHET